MNTYLITYYLKEESHSCGCGDHGDHDHHHHHHEERDDYEVTAHIKTLGAWAHLMPTSFLVKTDKNSEEIVSFLKDFLEEKDMIFVNKVDKEDLASLTPGVVEWIRQ
ncbi:MAG: hypothetical protein KIC66_15225 [Clostridium sp.]|uniref:Uncharacterized protein n=2 Tax=Clostridium paraputrificum TaxID=29363 RepID=A0A6N3B2P3_9CLOT|nr:hypothetical protein [Clostridium sp.]MBS5928410.1 hypothetical protein [Clostridium sp.]MBS5985328.1 hypothetical protein [Clostridium sp.]